jgi:RimJ/RimL family protein N-acetyltransferase
MSLPGPPNPHAWLPAIELEGPRVRLELLAKRHAADLFAAADIELFRHLISSAPEWTPEGFERDVERMLGFPNDIPYAIVLKATGRAIGRTAFREINPQRRGLEIGRTVIGRAWHGKGVNPEVKYLMLRHAFEGASPPAARVALWTNVTNLHSQAAISKLGAKREGVLRRYFADPHRPSSPPKDIIVYSIIAEEWPEVKAGLEKRIAGGTQPFC